METDQAVDLARQAVMLTLTVSAPLLGTALVVALIVSTLQAVTQVQEYTLSFVPKIVAVMIAAAIAGPWMIQRVVEFAREMFQCAT